MGDEVQPQVPLHFLPYMLLKFFGIYEVRSSFKEWSFLTWIHHFIAFGLIFNNFWVVLGMMLYLYNVDLPFLNFLFNAGLCMISTDTSFKMAYVAFKRNQFCDLMNTLKSYHWVGLRTKMPETGDSTSWGSIPSIDRGAVISLFLVTLGTGLPVLFALLEGRTFYNSWYPWDSQDPMWFCVQFFSETFTAMFLTYFVVLFCYFYVKVIALICSQLEYLGDSLLELRQRTEELSGVNNVNKGWEILYELQQLSNSQVEQFPIPKHVEIRMQEELRKLIQHHNELYRFMNDVRDFYSTLFLVQFVAIGIDICFSLYVSLTTPVYDIEFFINNVVWIYQGPQLFFYCWLGTKLTETAYGVREAAYGSEWYSMPQSFKTCILTIMTRCDQKFKLTVGKFTTVSVETFITILQSIGSYMAVMSSLTQRDENPTAVTSTNSTVY